MILIKMNCRQLKITGKWLKPFTLSSFFICPDCNGCTRLTAASDKVYQLLGHDRWFSPGTPASSTTKIGRHISESGIKHQKSNQIKSLTKSESCMTQSLSHPGPIFLKRKITETS
jgi:hypothetical protein